MIGCDDPECKYEWVSSLTHVKGELQLTVDQFHLECVGLKEVPEDDEWYCRECSQRREAKSRRR
jgi:hypothetical protein